MIISWPLNRGRDTIAVMPRKRRNGKTVDATGVVLKAVRLELPENVHYALRQAAAKNEMSMASYARKLVEQGLGMGPKKGVRKASEESGEKGGGK